MQWNSVSDFLAMGGYGLYVWGSYSVMLVWMLAEPVLVRRRLRRAVQRVEQRLELAQEQA